MRIPPAMPEIGGLDAPRRPHTFARDELLSHTFCGGLDMDIMLERLFDTLPGRRP